MSTASEMRRANRQEAMQQACDLARKCEVSPDELLTTARWIAAQHTDHHREREAAKTAARNRTGLNARDIARLENAGYDYAGAWLSGGKTGERMRNWDVFAAELASEYPILGLGHPDDLSADYGAELWRVLREGRLPPPSAHDLEILREASEYILSSRSGPDDPEIVQAAEEHFEAIKARATESPAAIPAPEPPPTARQPDEKRPPIVKATAIPDGLPVPPPVALDDDPKSLRAAARSFASVRAPRGGQRHGGAHRPPIIEATVVPEKPSGESIALAAVADRVLRWLIPCWIPRTVQVVRVLTSADWTAVTYWVVAHRLWQRLTGKVR